METHSRAEAHSAVGGAAYRLGLKLYDRRLKRAFDFRKRTAGDEVVFQTTVAPPGAPPWATDPQELWNRVESAERRKDAQIARDYRVPLPLGLSDADVCAMALEIAQYISQKLTTPVSIGVHRDAPITAFGEAKTGAERGCHAHLYFPTRKLLLDDAASDDEKSGGTGMGEKLSFLSNKSTAGYFIEDVNKLWAEAANRFTDAVGLVADYDHRSYRRQGLKIQPQPRLGEAVTAMQRQGHITRRGAHVLEVKAMSEVYRRVLSHKPAHPRTPWRSVGVTPSQWPHGERASPKVAAPFATAETVTAGTDTGPSAAPMGQKSLSERFKDLYFVGMEESDRPEQTIVFRLVLLIERALNRLRGTASELDDVIIEKKKAQTETLDARANLTEWQSSMRRNEDEAQAQASMWQRMIRGVGAWMDASEAIEVQRQSKEDEDVERRLQSQVVTKARKVQDLEEQAKPLRRAVVEHRSQMRVAARDLHQAHEAAVPQLLAVCWEEERQYLERFAPQIFEPMPEAGDGRRGKGRVVPAFAPPGGRKAGTRV
jgi:hypothetical protein